MALPRILRRERHSGELLAVSVRLMVEVEEYPNQVSIPFCLDRIKLLSQYLPYIVEQRVENHFVVGPVLLCKEHVT